MSSFVERPRYLCSLGGAVGTLNALPRVVPILHSSGGCGATIYTAQNGGGAYSGNHYCGGMAVPSTNVVEQEIVFGGEDRLKEEITNTLQLIDADLYFVVTGCMVEMIGDDASSVARGFRRQGSPVLEADTGGIKGNSYLGYDIVLEALFREYVEVASEKVANQVNLFGIVPIQDVFWRGNLEALRGLLEKLGLKVNTFFGVEEGLEELKKAGASSLNIVLSDIYGIQPAKAFEEVHGTPYISHILPIGPSASADFLRAVGSALGIDKAFVERVIAKETKIFYSYFERLADAYNDLDLQRLTVIVGDINYTKALTKFLADDLGWLPEVVAITDLVSDEEKEVLAQSFGPYASGLVPQIVFETNSANVLRHVKARYPETDSRYKESFNPGFVIGSVFERELSESLQVPLLTVTFPVSNRSVLDRAYAGYSGALRLTEDLVTTIFATR